MGHKAGWVLQGALEKRQAWKEIPNWHYDECNEGYSQGVMGKLAQGGQGRKSDI